MKIISKRMNRNVRLNLIQCDFAWAIMGVLTIQLVCKNVSIITGIGQMTKNFLIYTEIYACYKTNEILIHIYC